MNLPKSEHPRLVIIGGGFAGISLARNLINHPVQVVMVDKRNYHTFQPLLYQVSTSGLEPDSIAYPIRKIFNKSKNIFFRLAEVQSINDEDNFLSTSIGKIEFDYLVIATGSKTNFFGNKNVEQNAMSMKSIPQALNLRSLILENLEEASITKDLQQRKRLLNFVIAGAGPTGVELSGALAELKKHVVNKDFPDLNMDEIQVHLIEGEDRVLPPMSKKASKNATKFLKKLGVIIHTNTFVEDYKDFVVETNSGKTFETETFVWSAGVGGAPVNGLKASSIIDKMKRYRVNHYNQVEGYEHIFALGDIALMQTKDWPEGHPMVAQPAIQQGKHLANNFKRTLKNQAFIPFTYFDKGTMATVGRNKAVVDLHKLKFGGAFAWFIWMFVHLWFLVGFRNRLVTFMNWVYSYINYDRAARIIVRPFKSKKLEMHDAD